jgi:hypothetical protein
MEYNNLWFRANYIAKEKKSAIDNGMKFAAFTGWQVLSSQGLKTPWEKYLVELGLKKKKKLSKEQLEIEERIAMQNVDRIIKEATNG